FAGTVEIAGSGAGHHVAAVGRDDVGRGVLGGLDGGRLSDTASVRRPRIANFQRRNAATAKECVGQLSPLVLRRLGWCPQVLSRETPVGAYLPVSRAGWLCFVLGWVPGGYG